MSASRTITYIEQRDRWSTLLCTAARYGSPLSTRAPKDKLRFGHELWTARELEIKVAIFIEHLTLEFRYSFAPDPPGAIQSGDLALGCFSGLWRAPERIAPEISEDLRIQSALENCRAK
ncbi:hypothetical protein RSOLAG1IB_06707 [Rhizoctonia solani AG-1 IB]|uniref:Uncharacterized protein n=1 Tax=Thanatephorus cucumeris (strain AG1-IB / isolate 7/3/14) TaxID=1108050 RepID=A0A0B7F8P4_THACB|nr:hypothetical protein RSOLAG1IB_06707 [Rhizoctonia solani AG-1 IB]